MPPHTHTHTHPYTQPLPFSEDHDFHLDCILALGPDLLIFLSCSTKVCTYTVSCECPTVCGKLVPTNVRHVLCSWPMQETILNIPTRDICGWLQERTR